MNNKKERDYDGIEQFTSIEPKVIKTCENCLNCAPHPENGVNPELFCFGFELASENDLHYGVFEIPEYDEDKEYKCPKFIPII